MRLRIWWFCCCFALAGLSLGCSGLSPAGSVAAGGSGSGEWASIAQAPGAPGAVNYTTPDAATTSIARRASSAVAASVAAPVEDPPQPTSPPPAVRSVVVTQTPPTQPAPAQPVESTPDFSFRFSVGDEVDVSLWREKELSATHTVLRDGTISPPLLDPVRVEGLTIRELRGELIPRYKKYIKDPRVSVRVVSVHSSRIFVLGEVRDPAAVLATGRMSMMQALAQSGGFEMATADRARIRIVRPVRGGKPRVFTVNADAVIAGTQRDVMLQPGDVVFVPTTGLGDWSRRLTQLFGPVGTMLGSVGSVAATVVAIESLNN